MRQRLWFAALALIAGLAEPAEAIIRPCNEFCTCASDCSWTCDFNSTCGAYGVCASGSGSGCTACLASPGIGLEDNTRPLRGLKDASTLPEERGEVTARLTWRLTQHVEESGLGTVFAGGTRFHLPGRAQAPALAFIHAGAPKNAQTPDLAVEFVTYPARTEAVATGWLSMGAKAVLVIDPSTRSVTVYQGQDVRTLNESDYLELPDVVPGWSLRVGEIFE